MSEMTITESRARLGYLLSEMLSLPDLPDDLNRMISDHLRRQLGLVDVLKPEFCLKIYPALAELAGLPTGEDESQPPAEATAPGQEPAAVTAESVIDTPPTEIVNGAAHQQGDHFDLLDLQITEQAAQDEPSESF